MISPGSVERNSEQDPRLFVQLNEDGILLMVKVGCGL
jgi:hypothetical protein